MSVIWKFRPVLVWVLLVFASNAFGDAVRLTEAEVSARFHRRSWQREHGLPDERVNCLLQTRDGYLWVGTQRGLARFDGRDFRVFNSINTPAFSSDEITEIVEDTQGALWLATRDGIVRMSDNTFHRLTLGEQYSPITDRAKLCRRHSRGIIAGRGLVLCWLDDVSTRRFAPEKPSESSIYIEGIYEDETGAVWMATRGGALRWQENERQLQTAPFGEALKDRPATALHVAQDGTMWVLFGDAVATTDFVGNKRWLAAFKQGKLLSPLSFDEAHFISAFRGEYIVPDLQGNLWLSGTKNGIHRFTGTRFELLPITPRLEEDYPLCATVDREGNLWIGTGQSGLQCWTSRKSTWHETGDTAAENNVWSLIQDEAGAVWAGTDDGVVKMGGGKQVDQVNTPAPLRNVRSLARDSEGVIWAGTMRDLHCLTNGSWSKLMLPGEWFETKIRAMIPASQGGLWIGTVMGLNHLHRGQVRKYTTAEGLPANEVRAILESTSGALWVGTLGGGLARFQSNIFSTISTRDGLSNDNVWALHEDSEGVLWIGTEHGLNRLKDGRVTTFTRGQGLPDNLVNSIVEDDRGRLWVGHDRGIYWVSKEELGQVAASQRQQVSAVIYHEAGGPDPIETNGQKSNPAGCKTRDGHLWFPTTRGALEIDPTFADLDTIAPSTVIEAVSAGGKLVWANLPSESADSPGDAPTAMPRVFHLPPEDRRIIQVNYAANTFVAPENARFRYRLHGLSDQWFDLGTRRELHLNDLRPGDYELEVVACNHHGVWQEKGAILGLHLAAFFYETWWFYLAAIGSLSGVVALALRWRLGELRKINELQRVNALNEQRRRIARDVHDDIGASLTHILRLSQTDSQPSGSSFPAAAAQRIARVAEAAFDNMGEIVWANNPEFDTLEDLVAFAREHAASFLSSTSLRWNLKFPDEVPPKQVNGLVRRHVLLILKEALRNVVKHARATQVDVDLEIKGQLLSLVVADDGCGWPADGTRRFGNGLTNMRSRAEEIGGVLEVGSVTPHGTRVWARIPLG